MIDIVIDIFNATAIKCSESILSAFGKKKSMFWHRPQLFLQTLNSSNFLRYDLL